MPQHGPFACLIEVNAVFEQVGGPSDTEVHALKRLKNVFRSLLKWEGGFSECAHRPITFLGEGSASRKRPRFLHLAMSASQQLLDFRHNHLFAGQIHIADTLPPDHTLLIDHIHVGNKLPSAV